MKKPLIALLLLFILLEVGARVSIDNWGGPVDKALDILETDRILAWRVRPNLKTSFFETKVHTDQNGFRIPESLQHEKSGAKIWTYGPSSAFGWGVGAEESYPFLIGDLMNANTKNLSQIGYTLRQGIILAKMQSPPENSIVIVSYGINELDRFRFFFPTNEPDEFFFNQETPLAARWVAETRTRILSLRFFTRFVAKLSRQFSCKLPPKLNLRIPPDAITTYLNSIQQIVKDANAKLLLVDTPYRPDLFIPSEKASEDFYQEAFTAAEKGDCKKANKALESFNRLETNRIRQDLVHINKAFHSWAKENHTPLVSASKLLSKKSDFFDPIHPSVEGHRKIAVGIRDEIFRSYFKKGI